MPDRFKLALKATLLEAMIHRYLERRDLRADWVQEVISRWPIKTPLLDAYVSRVFPRGAVLGGTSRANDRARQLGAHVIDAAAISHGSYLALSRVLEPADEYVRRRSAEFGGEDVEPDETQQRFADAVRWLARRVAGRVIRIRFFARDDVPEPQTLGVVLHEIAHLETAEHDHRFIDRLQLLAGLTAKVLSEGGPALAAALRRGDPDGRGKVRAAPADDAPSPDPDEGDGKTH